MNSHALTKSLLALLVISCFYIPQISSAQSDRLTDSVKISMYNATRFMVEKAGTQGGYVGFYTDDFSRRWGELEAYKTQIWLQSPGGTIDMGNTFLDAYRVTGDEYYYQAAEQVAQALIWGQLPCGGWNYLIDFAGESSLKNWYNTIGKNAWGFEEFYHYYGNATFDDGVSAGAASFLLRIYLEKTDVKYKPALDKAIQFVMNSQYPLGGWPQRYPLKYEFPHGYAQDYTSFYTFNDDVIANNIGFLINCYHLLGRNDLLDPILRGMNFFLISQGGRLQAGWGEQHNMLLKPDHGRSYEPPAFSPGATFRNVLLLMEFFKLTGDDRFIARIPDAIAWLERIKLPNAQSQAGRYTHPTFVELETNRTLYAHRKGSDVINGKYWWDYKDDNPLLHYGAKTKLDLERLKKEYQSLAALSPQELATMLKHSPLKTNGENNPPTPQEQFKEKPYPLIGRIMDLQMLSSSTPAVKTNEEIRQIIRSLKNGQYWESRHLQISRPYAILPDGTESNTAKLSNEGGAAITDSSDQIYISTRDYIKNMKSLMGYLKTVSN